MLQIAQVSNRGVSVTANGSLELIQNCFTGTVPVINARRQE